MLDDLHAQLRGTLDQQFAALKQHYEQTIADVRRQTAADAERDSAARLQAARAEWDSALSSIIESTRVETRQQAEEAGRLQRRALEQQLQEQLEQTVQHAVNSVRKTSELEIESLRRRVTEDVDAERKRGEAALQTAVEAERVRAQETIDETTGASERRRQEFDAERQRLQQELEEERARARRDLAEERTRAKTELETVQQLMEAEIASAQAEAAAAHEAAARAALEIQTAVVPADSSAGTALAHVPGALRTIDAQPSVSEILSSLVQQAGSIAGRAVLFVIKGDTLTPWMGAVGIPAADLALVSSSIGGADLLARAARTGQATLTSAQLPAPPFAKLGPDQHVQRGIAVPLMITGRAVAVLYADGGGSSPTGAWAEAIDALGRHGSAMVSLRAAIRTLDLLRGDAADPGAASGAAGGGNGGGNGEESARRYARLLVSEIKLYNEAAVRAGRQQRDLRQRLRTEIDRAQRLYEERVPPAVGARDHYFHQELVQTLADGDATLLG